MFIMKKFIIIFIYCVFISNLYASDIWTVRSKHVDGKFYYVAQAFSESNTRKEALEKCRNDDPNAVKNPKGCLVMEIEFPNGVVKDIWDDEKRKYIASGGK